MLPNICRDLGRRGARMEQRISLVTLGVKDLARARDFYGTLGWKPGFDDGDVVFYQAGSMILALWGGEKLAEDGVFDDGGVGERSPRTALSTTVAAGGASPWRTTLAHRPRWIRCWLRRKQPGGTSDVQELRPSGAGTQACSSIPRGIRGGWPTTLGGRSPPEAHS